MKMFKPFICLLVIIGAIGILLFTLGCSVTEKDPAAGSPCVGVAPETSYICSIVPNPQDLSFILQLANAAAMKEDIYEATDALKVIDTLIALLEPGLIKYNEVFDLVNMNVDPVIFVIVQEYQGQFAELDILILPYDLDLILRHLKKQRNIILMAIQAYSWLETECLESECFDKGV